ncbi:3-deoxy-manno-octulosonate cytidylyltransferase [Eisenibacter elegans]|jgi:3-deoxy-manno-octulosonate cytidylyltransferase (CMP-KDO synthetase)|uniref:3-deoxy-manno-octulosonate cytidylyltransferase n=1 Tax=Eisenibacter elegans TaxID=997 RepID=UPI000413469E|nr:3-deoxy-manno-octulosonate cytidylyltransferase [Eisenibacter elegans]
MTKILGIIPARYNSTRLPGKALIDLGGKSMLQRVYEQVRKAQQVDRVVVATDDARIYEHVLAFGGEAAMTDPKHQNGTDRCAEVAQQIGAGFEVCINIQGDEPFIDPSQIDAVAALFAQPDTQIGTLVKKIDVNDQIFDEKEAKVIFNAQHEAILFSRSPLPYLHQVPKTTWAQTFDFYKHLGIYGFRTEILANIAQLPPDPLEQAESLEQLRWLAHYRIKIAFSHIDTVSVDTPEDLEKVRQHLATNPQ